MSKYLSGISNHRLLSSRREITVRVTLMLVLSIQGCYGFRGGSAPAHLRTIYIPQADDASGLGWGSVRENMTRTLIRKFRDDNSLRVSDAAGSDSRLEVSITSIVTGVLNTSKSEQQTVLGVKVQARVTFFDNVKKKAIFKDRSFEADGQYPTSNPDQKNKAIEDAVEEITTNILLASVADW